MLLLFVREPSIFETVLLQHWLLGMIRSFSYFFILMYRLQFIHIYRICLRIALIRSLDWVLMNDRMRKSLRKQIRLQNLLRTVENRSRWMNLLWSIMSLLQVQHIIPFILTWIITALLIKATEVELTCEVMWITCHKLGLSNQTIHSVGSHQPNSQAWQFGRTFMARVIQIVTKRIFLTIKFHIENSMSYLQFFCFVVQ